MPLEALIEEATRYDQFTMKNCDLLARLKMTFTGQAIILESWATLAEFDLVSGKLIGSAFSVLRR
jgi:hypothetical protein